MSRIQLNQKNLLPNSILPIRYIALANAGFLFGNPTRLTSSHQL
uniref:Uncharacterized protein n=1 Tax=Arundo donax TaxID=35708 RepID=A0A0A9CMR1_ARUDO